MLFTSELTILAPTNPLAIGPPDPQVLATTFTGFCRGISHRGIPLETEALLRPVTTAREQVQLICRKPFMGTMEEYRADLHWLRNEISLSGKNAERKVVRLRTHMPPEDALRTGRPWAYHETRIDLQLKDVQVPDLFMLKMHETDLTKREPCFIGRNVLIGRTKAELHRDTRLEWSLFCRTYGSDADTAQADSDRFIARVARDFNAFKAQVSCVVVDSNPAYDAGWAD